MRKLRRETSGRSSFLRQLRSQVKPAARHLQVLWGEDCGRRRLLHELRCVRSESCGRGYKLSAQAAASAAEQYATAKSGGLGRVVVKSNDPEILEAARKNKKSRYGCAWILLLIFPSDFCWRGCFSTKCR